MKSVSEIINNFKENLKSLNSPLASFTNYSNIYIIIRAIALIINEQYEKLRSYYLNSYLINATGISLDKRAQDFNIYRAPGSPSVGFVFASANTTTNIPKGTILNTATNNFQYETIENKVITSQGEYIPIQCLTNSELANLNANTLLVSPFYPLVSFIVGQTKDLNNNYIGGLQGGLSLETDNALKGRVFSQLRNLTRGTFESINNKLNELGVPKFFIKESYPVTGYFTIFLNTQNQALLDIVETQVLSVKPVGVSFEVKPLNNYYIDVKFKVTLLSLDFAESVSDAIKETCYNYFNSLDLEQELYPINLSVLCSGIPGVRDIRIIEPESSIITSPKNSLIKLRNLDLTFKEG